MKEKDLRTARDIEYRTFTAVQLKHFKAYERVRSSGLFNMFDRRARDMTRLARDDYHFVMNNYTELRTASEQA